MIKGQRAHATALPPDPLSSATLSPGCCGTVCPLASDGNRRYTPAALIAEYGSSLAEDNAALCTLTDGNEGATTVRTTDEAASEGWFSGWFGGAAKDAGGGLPAQGYQGGSD